MNVLSRKRLDQLQEALRLGLSDREIMRMMRMGRATIFKHRRALGIEPKPHGYRPTDRPPLLGKREQSIIDAVRAGAIRPCEVQRATGLPRSILIPLAEDLVQRGLLSALNGKPWAVAEQFAPILPPPRQVIEEALASAFSIAEAARSLGVSWDMFRRWMTIHGVERQRREFTHLRGAERYAALRALNLCTRCERCPPTPGLTRCAKCRALDRADQRRGIRRRVEAGICIECGKPSRGMFRCADCRARRASQRPTAERREPMMREWGTFLNEDLAQEKILAELEGRAFDPRDFYKRHAPRDEIAIMDRPLGDDGDGDTMHGIHGAPASGSPWLAPRISGGVANPAEERMVRRLDREPTIEELRAEAEGRPWQSYVHAVSLENAEEAVSAWLEFIARMTPDEFAETNIEAQIEAIMPGLSMGEILRCVREALAWSERDLERRAEILPGIVRQLERGERYYRDCPLRAIAQALCAVTELEPGRLQAHISAAWGPVHARPERPAVIESQKAVRQRQKAVLTHSLGDARALRGDARSTP